MLKCSGLRDEEKLNHMAASRMSDPNLPCSRRFLTLALLSNAPLQRLPFARTALVWNGIVNHNVAANPLARRAEHLMKEKPMRSLSLNFSLTALITLCAWGYAAPGQASLRDTITHSTVASVPASQTRLAGIMQDHVYLTDPGSVVAVDVTKTLYVAQGQTYAVLHGVSIAIVLDHDGGLVFDANGRSIGFILRIEEPAVAPAAIRSPNPV